VPLSERRVGDTDGSARVRAGYSPIMSLTRWLGGIEEITHCS
jgi:hypothetical protein